MNNNENNPAPPTLDHIIGQTRAVQQLRTALDAYFNDRAGEGEEQAFPHVLLVGPPGCGKSLLSQLVAAELASKLHEELAQNILSAEGCLISDESVCDVCIQYVSFSSESCDISDRHGKGRGPESKPIL
jgi:Holliday junction resolvasome RuvABC ATP-dependent DNA helicase subunit